MALLNDTEEQTGGVADQISNSLNQNSFMATDSPYNEYSATLGKFTGQEGPQLSADGIAAPQNEYERQVQERAAQYDGTIPAQSFDTYYPSARNDIQKGSYSGSMVGSNPIYAASMLMPYGLIDARQNALKAAADKKAAEMDAFKGKILGAKAPKTKHKAVQNQIQEKFYEGLSGWVDKAKKENPNSDPYKALAQNPEFKQWQDNINTLAEYEDQGAGVVAQYEKEVGDGKMVETPYTKQLLNDWYEGKHATLAMNPDTFKQAEAHNIFKLKGITDANKLAEEVGKSLPQNVTGTHYTTPGALYDVLTTTTDKSVDAEALRNSTQSAYKVHFTGRPDAPPYEEFAKMVAARTAKEHEENVKTVSVKGDGADEIFDESAIQKEESSLLVGRQGMGVDKNGDPINVQKNMPAKFGYTMKSPVKINLAGSEEMYDLGDSQGGIIQKAPAGNKEAEIQTFTNVPTVRMPGSDKYAPVDEEGLANAKKNGYPVKWDLYGVASFQGDEASEFKQKTVLVPASQVKNSVQKSRGKTKTGVDFDKMDKYTKQLNEKEGVGEYKDRKNDSPKKQIISVSAYNKAKGTKYTKAQITSSLGSTYDITD